MSDSKLALVFPGQGSQSVGMVSELAERWPQIRETMAEASEGARMDLWALASQGPEQELNRTRNTQPALLAASVAMFRLWRDLGGPEPSIMAGHSLGEYSALVCGGALSLVDAAALVAERGRLMQEAVAEGEGAMAAILGAADDQVAEVCRELAGDEVVSPANYNAPGQLVIAGHRSAVERVIEHLRGLGLRKIIMLPVSVPSHCWLMRDAAEKLGDAIGDLRMVLPRIPVVQNCEAHAFDTADAIRDALVRQLYQPVRWTGCVQELRRQGVDRALECGPGKVLCGLIKRIDRDIECLPLGTPDAMSAALDTWGKSQ